MTKLQKQACIIFGLFGISLIILISIVIFAHDIKTRKENFKIKSSDWETIHHNMWRIKVPNGWLVVGSRSTFIPDKDHIWLNKGDK